MSELPEHLEEAIAYSEKMHAVLGQLLKDDATLVEVRTKTINFEFVEIRDANADRRVARAEVANFMAGWKAAMAEQKSEGEDA